jgi:predicted transcriptional regulator
MHPVVFNKSNENHDTLEFQGRGDDAFWFACVDLKILKDPTLSPCDKTVFSVICAHVDVQTRSCPLRVKTLAEEVGCSVRTVQDSLKALLERGVIERTERFEDGKQKASVYKIVGQQASCYRGADSAPSEKSAPQMGANFAPISESCTPRGAKNDTPSLREPNINEIRNSPSERETSFPNPEATNFSGSSPSAHESPPDVRTAQELLKALLDRGVIERTERFEDGKQRASVYEIVGHQASCYRGADPAPSEKSAPQVGANFAPTSESCTPRGAKNDTPSLQEPNINEIRNSPSERETSFPNPEAAYFSGPSSFAYAYPPDLIHPSEVPLAMRETVDYFLLKTGRTAIGLDELAAIRKLEEIHTPARVNKEIAQAVDRFLRNGKSLSLLTLVYIYKSLQYQTTRKFSQGKSAPQKYAVQEKTVDPYEGCYL